MNQPWGTCVPHPELPYHLLLHPIPQGHPSAPALSTLSHASNLNWRLITLQYCGGFCHTLTWISHGCTCVPHPEPPSHLLPYPIPQGHPSAPTLSTLSHALNLDWRSISHMIIYMFQCYSLKSSHPWFLPHPTESKSLFFISVSLLLSLLSPLPQWQIIPQMVAPVST